jgi:hypothetical protein
MSVCDEQPRNDQQQSNEQADDATLAPLRHINPGSANYGTGFMTNPMTISTIIDSKPILMHSPSRKHLRTD